MSGEGGGVPMKLSVLMSVYHKESPVCFRQCLDSIVAQTLPVEELIVVEDGPLGAELKAVIAEYSETLPITSLPLPSQSGLGAALRAGLDLCHGEYVARMDTDDISVPERFQKQVAFLKGHPNVHVVGGAIAEFDRDWRTPQAVRTLPQETQAIARYARYRNPLNHMTVMFRRAEVMAVGGYQSCAGFEDYYLWVRMLLEGYNLENMAELLVYARCGNGMQNRRGGFTYLTQEINAQFAFREIGFLNLPECLRNILMRGPVRVAPSWFRALLYRTFLRKNIGDGLASAALPD
jgi:O104-antigen biosynthesis beta-1,3-galactosyltransferase